MPIAARHGDLIGEQIAAGDGHRQAEQKFTDAAGRAACASDFWFRFHLCAFAFAGEVTSRRGAFYSEAAFSRKDAETPKSHLCSSVFICVHLWLPYLAITPQRR